MPRDEVLDEFVQLWNIEDRIPEVNITKVACEELANRRKTSIQVVGRFEKPVELLV
jgi:hypothetical protein